MLYAKIRYARQIGRLFRLRHLLHGRHADFGPRLGYSKRGRYYYALVRRLKDEGILDSGGRFNETVTNRWVAELEAHAGPEVRALGFRTTFDLYLSLLLTDGVTTGMARGGLGSSARSVYLGMRKLAGLSLIRLEGQSMRINGSSPIFRWLEKYIQLAMVQADMDRDLSPLFDAVPGYIDGPQAHFMMNYVPGRTLGPSDMVIRTGPLFEPFWRLASRSVGYLASYPRKLEILPAERGAEVAWYAGLPYNRNARGYS